MTEPAQVRLLFEHPPAALPIDGEDAAMAVRRIYCVGRNYVSHIREMREGDERDPPFFFQKPRDALVQDGGRVPYPAATDRFEHEVELVVAIGREGRDVRPADALDHALGFAVGIDLTRRDRQFEAREQSRPWEPGKSFDHSAPCGPLRRRALAGPLEPATLSLWVNGERRQHTRLASMIWDTAEIIARLSSQYRLMPGDLIFTGTPDGVGPLRPGDEVKASCDGLAPLTITIEEALR